MASQKFKQTEIGKIPKGWKIKKLGDVTEVQNGFAFKASEFTESGIPVIKIKNVSIPKVNFDDVDYYSGPMENLKEFIIKDGDILISMTGSHINQMASAVARVCLYKFDYPAVLNQRVGKIYPRNNGKLINLFLYYYLSQKLIQIELASSAGGSANQANISSNQIKGLTLPLPPLPEQKAIASILSSLDAKIELNNKMNKTLEEIGQAIFRKWFIDNPEKENWEEKRLGELGDFKNGINYLRGEKGDTEFSIINVRDISGNKWLMRNNLDKINIDSIKAKDYLIKDKDIIVARSACPGKISLFLGELEGVIYSGFSIRYRLNNKSLYFYISFILDNLRERIDNLSIGTTLSSVNQETLKNIIIRIPNKDVLDDFNKLIEPIFKQISNNCFQSQILSQTRDSLLPKLMSGEVRVK